MHCGINSIVLFLESTNVSFINNKAINGGGLFANNNSTISFQRFALVNFIKNEVMNNGGVGYFNMHCNITFTEYANVAFENNNALYGGALYISSDTSVTFDDNSTLLFKNNMATNDGSAINILRNSNIRLKDSTKITFTASNAQYGGAMFFDATHTTLAFTNHTTLEETPVSLVTLPELQEITCILSLLDQLVSVYKTELLALTIRPNISSLLLQVN